MRLPVARLGIAASVIALVVCCLFLGRPERQVWACALAGPAAPVCDVILGVFVPAESVADEGVPVQEPPPPLDAREWVAEPPPPPACPPESQMPRLLPRRAHALWLARSSCCDMSVASACALAASILDEPEPLLAERFRARACALGDRTSCEGPRGDEPGMLATR